MKSVSVIVAEIAAIGSTLAKQKIVSDYANNKALEMTFYYAENPRFNYWIKADPTTMVGKGTREIDIDTFAGLNQLIGRNVTGNAARQFLTELIGDYTPAEGEIICRIVNKDLRCNCGTAIANKVWKDLIPEYPVMLAAKFDEKAVKYLTKFEGKDAFIVQNKEDGGRCIVKVDESGNVTYHSRNGNTLDLFGIFDTQFEKFPNTIFDGELLVKQEDGKPNRKLGNGFYTKAVRGTLTKAEAVNFSITLWDVITTEEFATIGKTPYRNRLGWLLDQGFRANISIVESKVVNTLAECQEFYGEMRARGEEGAIIKVASAVWEDKRSKDCVKLKAVNDCDALCIGVEEGQGKYAGKIGALVCRDSTGELLFNVGTGLTDADRERDPSYYVGNIVEVVYNSLITSKSKETKSLFLPVFRCVRLDKTKPNHVGELRE
jgi:ATP-dependent DNA ligase